MYKPNHTTNDNIRLSLDLIKSYPLGLIISNTIESSLNSLELNYLPFYISEAKGVHFLIGHFAKSNPQCRNLDGKEVVVCFQGPNRYISPTMYHSPELNVPTWNYAVVHAHGVASTFTQSNEINKMLNEATQIFESENGTDWEYNLPQPIKTDLEAGIIGVSIKITQFDSKFKLSLNRNKDDYDSVINYLNNSSNSKDAELLKWMRKTAPNENDNS